MKILIKRNSTYLNTSTIIVCILFVYLFAFHITILAQPVVTDMILIPSGEFVMGKNSERGFGFSPAHTVTIDSFYIDRHEVTNAEYKAFCDATGHRLPEFWNNDIFRCGDNYPNHPVIGINWYDANKYAEWTGKRLPTEAEWEYAARGGLVNKDYPTGDTLGRIEGKKSFPWINRIAEAGLFPPNNYGLYDMDGNVWEWVADSYDENYYADSPALNPKGPADKINKVIRGGSWHSGPMCKRVYFRKGLPANWVDFAVGFRCARD